MGRTYICILKSPDILTVEIDCIVIALLSEQLFTLKYYPLNYPLYHISGCVFHLANLYFDDCENVCTSSYFHHHIWNMKHYPLFGLGHATNVCATCLAMFYMTTILFKNEYVQYMHSNYTNDLPKAGPSLTTELCLPMPLNNPPSSLMLSKLTGSCSL